MDKPTQDIDYKPYRKTSMDIITRGLSFFILAGFLINGFWFFWDSFRKILVQEFYLLLLFFFSVLINRIIRRKGWELGALRLYTAAGIATGMFFVFTVGDEYLFVGMIILTLFALISIFSLNRRESMLWSLLCFAGGMVSLYLRYIASPVNSRYGADDLIQIYLFMSLMSSLLLFLGYSTEGIIKDYIRQIRMQSVRVENLLAREKGLNDKYQSVFSLIPDLLVIFDREGRIYDGNRIMRQYAGLSEEELITRNLLEFLPRVKKDELTEKTDSLAGENVLEGLEVQVAGLVGDDRLFEASMSCVMDESGERRFIALARDITERKKMELTARSRAEELYKLSITDALTGLNNRLRLDDFLSSEIDKAVRYGSVFSIMLCDIDRFKLVNDSYGHSTGDRVLIRLADLLRDSMRRTDLAGRWGGEEFLIICPETAGEDALSLAEKIRLSAREMDLPKEERITLSFGVTQFREGDDMDTIMTRVDKALYRAKDTGRDRSVRI